MTEVDGASSHNDGGSNKDRETLSIVTVDSSGPVADAKCTLTNSKGEWLLTAPDNIEVRRSYSGLTIKCEKSGYDPVVTTLTASKTQVPRPAFHFAGDSNGDDEMITVPQYAPNVTVTLGTRQATTN
ncbi:hypothetical protein IQ285_12870 [Burkholderia sp. R-69608]|uniref:hypothetical protein n=1 Tax=Paraburkholderia nemoris TaxID=2793076 RepID=UPI001913508F|nr:hypothetical protein [Paraburkholderia nemoris]MBK5148575.1 hypothetical protein [Burkholderia sp. R-69608]